MLTLIKTTSDNPDFKKLTALFDEYLVIIDGDDKDFYAQYNQIYLDHVIVCYENDIAVGCGAFKEYAPEVVEIKRMFTHPGHRQKGIANTILNSLESWAKELEYKKSILETSYKLKNAISIYKKSGYNIIDNYGQYIGVSDSVCMEKIFNS
jgi:putative acetyltransferase